MYARIWKCSNSLPDLHCFLSLWQVGFLLEFIFGSRAFLYRIHVFTYELSNSLSLSVSMVLILKVNSFLVSHVGHFGSPGNFSLDFQQPFTVFTCRLFI